MSQKVQRKVKITYLMKERITKSVLEIMVKEKMYLGTLTQYLSPCRFWLCHVSLKIIFH